MTRGHRAAEAGTSGLDRLGLACGVAAAAAYVAAATLFVAMILPKMPPMDAPAAARVAFYASMHGNAAYQCISYLGELQLVLLIPFFGGLLGVLRRAEGETGALSLTVFAAGVALAILGPVAILIEDHLLLGLAAAGADAAVVTAIDGLVPLAIALGGFPQALVLAGTAVLLPRHALGPRWLARLGHAIAVLSLVGTGTLVSGAMFPVSHVASLLARLWLLALALVLLWRVGLAAAPAEATRRPHVRTA